MNPGISVLERAFQLAATGRYDTVTQINGNWTRRVTLPASLRFSAVQAAHGGNFLRTQFRPDRKPRRG